MSFNFPNTPTVGDLYPTPALPGVPQYRWDGAVWTTTTYDPLTWVQRAGDTMTGALNVVTPPTLPAHAASKAYVDAASVAAAPFADAMAYSGMQINGSMDVSQEKGYDVGAASGEHACDGWRFYKSGTMAATSGSYNTAAFPGFTKCLLISVTTPQASLSANDYVVVLQGIEGYRVAKLAWGTPSAKPITIGFWSMHTTPGVYTGTIRNGATNNRSYGFTYTQAVADVQQYNTITIPGDTTGTWPKDNSSGIGITFAMASGASNLTSAVGAWENGAKFAAPGQVNGVASASTFRITGVVVLPGIYAPTAAQSPLIMRPYDQELVTCRRYYFKTVFDQYQYMMLGSGYGTGTVIGMLSWYPTMRAIPTMTSSGGGAFIAQAQGGDTSFNSISFFGFADMAYWSGTLAAPVTNEGASVRVYANPAGTWIAGNARL